MSLEDGLTLTLPSGKGKDRETQLQVFADTISELSNRIGFPMSSRGWGYQLEGFGLINKSEFGRVEDLVNECRKNGMLPVDFTSDEEGRQFSCVEEPDTEDPESLISRYVEGSLYCENNYTPDWWKYEHYYIQMLVEKIDLKTLFEPICEKYHIPIATSKGWGSIRQRAEYGRRFKEAEERGLECVLLYCGDHDPAGLQISDGIMKNLKDVSNIRWKDGTTGYNPENLIIDRFGLNYDFIVKNNLTWIDNLQTGSGKRLDDPTHKNYPSEFVQNYLKKVGVRKCEANALVVRPDEARELVENAIKKYLLYTDVQQDFEGIINPSDRFRKCQQEVYDTFKNVRENVMVIDGVSFSTMVNKILTDNRNRKIGVTCNE